MKKQSISALPCLVCNEAVFARLTFVTQDCENKSIHTLIRSRNKTNFCLILVPLILFWNIKHHVCVCIYICPHVYLSWQFMLGVLFVTSVLQDMLRSVYEMVAYKNSATWLYFHFPHVHLWPTKNYFNTCNIFSLFSSRCVSIFVIVIEVWVFPKWIYVVVIYYSPALTPSQWWKVEGSCHWVEQKKPVSDICC